MIEKLSDERIALWVDSIAETTKKLGSIATPVKKIIEESLKASRDYYDAQIDKQAKTMEDITVLLQEAWDCIFHLQLHVPVKDRTRELLNKISAVVYAAGGTIKE